MQKTILYSVLNWGLGHATRSIPIIRHLIAEGHELIIASDGLALSLLKKEFPSLKFEELTAYDAIYATKENQFNIKLATQIPKFIQAIKTEHIQCQKLCEKHSINAIISDNRYGFHHATIPSAFICHQLKLLYPDSRIAEAIINKSYQGYLKNFTQLWVPDLAPPNNISGNMSKLKWDNVHYLGIDSRLKKKAIPKTYDCLAILSGPEPQRSLLEAALLEQLNEIPGNHYLLRGTDLESKLYIPKNIQVTNMMTSDDLNKLINQSERVICRSGYTSVIDLLKLGKSAILVPTPGQAEQEYLAKNLAKKKWFIIQSQSKLDLSVKVSSCVPELKFGYNGTIIQQFLSFPIS